ncbi:class I SAM-dependent methyltransferase [Telmatospirillum sp.]|uniref:class I SAM-dependent methyltransferase n=1 Tax=Telmatospirillum sp. TaxID=2079197 RepID=UPI002841F5C7|nr:class I SAM-dependent methyltransferase [Telmatospirillum sp.]MDR3435239.1 class I SAM-dependent methyltransferase [Telmatospirillum sp.]
MTQHVCPWWLGYTFITPLRRLFQDPLKILAPYVHEGMTVLEPGPGMGFFTLDMARLVGSSGQVFAIDLQPEMLKVLRRRAVKAGLQGRVQSRLAQSDSLDIADLNRTVDFVLAFAMVHEVPAAHSFFGEMFDALKPGGTLLLAEPRGHVGAAAFQAELDTGAQVGFQVEPGPSIRRSYSALLEKREA